MKYLFLTILSLALGMPAAQAAPDQAQLNQVLQLNKALLQITGQTQLPIRIFGKTIAINGRDDEKGAPCIFSYDFDPKTAATSFRLVAAGHVWNYMAAMTETGRILDQYPGSVTLGQLELLVYLDWWTQFPRRVDFLLNPNEGWVVSFGSFADQTQVLCELPAR